MASTLIDGVDDNDPRLRRAMRALEATLSFFVGNDLTPENIERMGAAIAWHRQQCKDKLGLDMPVLTAVVLPRLGFIKIVRADLAPPEIETLIVNLATQFGARGIRPGEIAVAIAAAFPSYRLLQ